MIFDTVSLEEKIGYVFKDKLLLRQCFTHASYANEHKEQNNERLEFFGDAIIQFVVTEYLYSKLDFDEGKLTVIRAELVSKKPLLQAVKKLKIDGFALLGKGQEKSVSLEEKLYSSLYESLVAGIFIDGGLDKAKKFITNTLLTDYNFIKSKPKTDGKGAFQEYVQKYKLGSILYETLSKSGPDHSPEFRVAVLLNNNPIAEGVGKSKKDAEASAAKKALVLLKNREGDTFEF